MIDVLLRLNPDRSRLSSRLTETVRRLVAEYELRTRLVEDCLKRMEKVSAVIDEINDTKRPC